MPSDPAPLGSQAEPVFPRVIDNTMYERWKTCPHSFFRADIQGLRLAELGEPGEAPRIRKSIHLHFGSVFAAGLEATRRCWSAGAGETEALAEGATTITRLWEAETDLPAPHTRTEEAKTLQSCLLAHVGYFREWPLDDERQQVYQNQGMPCIELSGARPIPGTRHPDTGEPILYAGRFDAVLDRAGQPWGLDDKTTGSHVEGESWARQWRLRGQFTGYCWLAQIWDLNIEWFIIHGIQLTGNTKPGAPIARFREVTEIRPSWMVERWLAQLQADVSLMCQQWDILWKRGTDAVPHPFSQAYGHACYDFNSPCQFQTLCGEPRPELFLDDYVVDRWDPLAIRGLD